MKRIENFVNNLSKDELEYLKTLINKPVETTNEQLTKDDITYLIEHLNFKSIVPSRNRRKAFLINKLRKLIV
jgi:hypothetical protein